MRVSALVAFVAASPFLLAQAPCWIADAPRPVGARPLALATGDLDADGELDLVSADYDGHQVTVLLQRADDFEPGVPYVIGFPSISRPSGLAIGDVDGDGDEDLAVARENMNDVLVMLNQGNGTFAIGPFFATGASPEGVAIGDLDADGDLDLAVACYGADSISVLMNQGSGAFAPHAGHASGNGPVAIVLVDVDGDGDLDVLAGHAADGRMFVFSNPGNGALAAGVPHAAGAQWSLAVGDLDADGDADVVTASQSSTVSVLLNQGSGSYSPFVTYPCNASSMGLALGDFDRDGDPDVVVGNWLGATWSILANHGNGTFGAPSAFAGPNGPRSIAAADFDRDGDLDLAVTGEFEASVAVLRDCALAGTRFCAGDGSAIPCPCGNSGAPGNGCASSLFAAGGSLSAGGVARVANDTVELRAANLTGSTCVFFQGDVEAPPAAIDDGIGCVGGSIIRLGTRSVAGGMAVDPSGGDAPISVRGQVPVAGATRHYQGFYRNAAAAFCPPATSNRTNGLTLVWIP